MRVRALLAIGAALAASSAAQEYRERVEVSVVEVPVNVLDGSGNAIPGLGIEDFELRVNGEVREVEFFDVLDLTATGVAEETALSRSAPGRIERRILLLIDTVFSGHRALFRGVDAAAQYVEDAHPDDLISVAAYRSGRVEYLTPFTRDRVLAYRAVRTLSAPPTEDPLRLTISPQLRAALEPRFDVAAAPAGEIRTAIEDPSSPFATEDWLSFSPAGVDDIGSFGPTGDVMVEGTGRLLAEMADDQDRRHIREQIETLGGVAQDLATLSGQKQILFVSQGFASNLVLRDNRLTRLLRQMQREFRQHGVIIHTINTDTLGVRKSLTTNKGQALFNLAYETGGVAYANSNVLASHFDRFERSQQVTYLLGFTPPPDVRPGYNEIDVTVRSPRARRILARPGFFGETDRVEPSEAAINLRLAEAVLGGGATRSDIRTFIEVSREHGFQTVAPSLQAVDLVAVGSPDVVNAEMMIYILRKGKVFQSKSKNLEIDLPQIRRSLEEREEPFPEARLGTRETFDLPPGEYVARVVFRLRPGNLIGVASAPVTVE